MGETIGILFTLLVLVCVLLAFFSGMLFMAFNFVESFYLVIFDRPIYVHFYPIRKDLHIDEVTFLEKEFSFYRKLTERQKKYFRHRVHRFIKHYQIVGRQHMNINPEVRLKIAATWVMLTFGMRSYKPDIFETIVVYPDIFESRNGNLHKGEFNPIVKAVVFSWKHFEEGFALESDNLNLGLHEFAHVLHLNATTAKRTDASSMVYADFYGKILDYLNEGYNKQHLVNLGYFRDYAFTNNHEFMAVVLEHFFETPREFRQRLPELYSMVQKMINYKTA